MLLTTPEIQRQLSGKFKRSRLIKHHGREKASELTGVPVPTIRRFEEESEISFRQFLMLAHVYGDVELLGNLFPEPEPKTIDELLNSNTIPKRGRT